MTKAIKGRLKSIEDRLERLDARLRTLTLVVLGNIAVTLVGAGSVITTLLVTRPGP